MEYIGFEDLMYRYGDTVKELYRYMSRYGFKKYAREDWEVGNLNVYEDVSGRVYVGLGYGRDKFTLVDVDTWDMIRDGRWLIRDAGLRKVIVSKVFRGNKGL